MVSAVGVDDGAWSLRRRKADRTQDIFGEFTEATLVERYNLADTLQVTGNVAQLSPFIVPGYGCTLADSTGTRRFNGYLSQIDRTATTCTLTYTGDLGQLWNRFVYPDPAHSITSQSADTDVRTGKQETVLLAYIAVNIGASALTARRMAGLVVPASAGRGATVKNTARLDVLGTLVAKIAEAANLRLTIVQSGTALNLVISDAPDLSASARFGAWDSGGPGVVASDWSLTYAAPTVTDAVAAGAGDLSTRVFREIISTGQETVWGLRVEDLIDESQTTDLDELDQAAQDAIDSGSTPVQITATVLDSPGYVLGRDVPLGAKVSLDLGGNLVVDRLRQLTTTIKPTDGSATVSVVPVIGSPDSPLTPVARSIRDLRRILRKAVSQ
jgi:hypothetical protein